MPTAQSGIFALGTGSHAYLEFTPRGTVTPAGLVRAVADLREPRTTTGGVNLVVGFRPSLWQRIAPGHAPVGVADFARDLQGAEGSSMPATQRDLWLWVAGHAYDRVFDASRAAIAALDPNAILADETAGWTYKENRDLTGFIHGTENPSLAEAPEVAVVPRGSPGEGSSVVLVQNWLHDIVAWESLAVTEQEQVMGQTKADSVELAEDVRGPSTSPSGN